MKTRRYRMSARAESVAETRSRVVASARQLLLEDDVPLTMDEVARRADVARATVYHQFSSKLGLLEAVILDFEERADLAEVVTVAEQTPADELVRAVVLAGCRYWSTDPELARKVIGLAALHSDVQEMLAGHDAGRLEILTHVLDRLIEARALSDRCTRDHALNVLWLLTSFDAYDLLIRRQHVEHDDVAEMLAQLADDQLNPSI